MKKHMPLDPAVTPWFAGVPTFMRCPPDFLVFKRFGLSERREFAECKYF
ncbi:MAG: hypothetical protein JSW26_11085 [Desulfobacterales bacterium]|nr:MAG: hypothetical protein JSW26_11085 [Desulfobacterales bacterium]